MAYENCDNEAVTLGYVQPIYIVLPFAEFAGLIRENTDLDSTFRIFDTDNQEWLSVNGHLIEYSFDPTQGDRDDPLAERRAMGLTALD